MLVKHVTTTVAGELMLAVTGLPELAGQLGQPHWRTIGETAESQSRDESIRVMGEGERRNAA